MYTLGHDFIPPGIHAGGLRYHGASPLVSQMVQEGHIETEALHQLACFEAATIFARTEGFLPAPESAHAIRAAYDEAIKCREEGTPRVIVFNFSGHGHFDLSAYEKYMSNELIDYEYPEAEVQKSLAKIPQI